MEDPEYSRDTQGSVYNYGVKLIPAWISDKIQYKKWDELVIKPQISRVAALKFENGELISFFIPPRVRFLIHARLFNIITKSPMGPLY